eukprot:6478607-Amphidinium_carterae.1
MEKQMPLKDASVLLSYAWLLETVFGPCLPILNALIAMLTKIYSALLFSSHVALLDMDECQEQRTSVQNFGFGSVTLWAFALMFANLPSSPDRSP